MTPLANDSDDALNAYEPAPMDASAYAESNTIPCRYHNSQLYTLQIHI